MDSVNILHVNSELAWGGGETQTAYLIEGLQGRGYQQALACQPQSALAKRYLKESMRVHLVSMPTQFSLSAIMRLRQIINEGKFDIAHFHTSRAHTLGAVASLGIHPLVRVVTRRIGHRSTNWLKARLIYNSGTEAIVAISEAVGETLLAKRISAEKLRVIPSGVDLKKFAGGDGFSWRDRLKISQNALVVAYVGKLSQGKGLDTLFRAIPSLAEKDTTTQFLIVGEGPERNNLEKLALQLKIEAHVIFAGFIEDIPGVLAVADVVVLPSLKEAAGNVVREAMAAGKPVVASRVGGLPESIIDGETGFLFPPGDQQALSRSLLTLIDNPALRERFGRAGRELVQTKFSVETMVRQYEALYHEALKRERTT